MKPSLKYSKASYFFLWIALVFMTSCNSTQEPKTPVEPEIVEETPEVAKKLANFKWANSKASGKNYDKTTILLPITLSESKTFKPFYIKLDMGSPASYINETFFYSRRNELKHTINQQDTNIVELELNLSDNSVFLADFYLSPSDFNVGGDDVIGVIGMSAFEGKKLLIDFPSNGFQILEAAAALSTPFATLEAVDLPAEYVNDQFILTMTTDKGDTLKLLYDVSTSEFPLVLANYKWEAVTGKTVKEANLDCVEQSTVDGTMTICGTNFSGDLKLGKLKFSSPEVFFYKEHPYTIEQISKSSGIYFDGLIGNKLFYDDYAILLDFTNKDSRFKVYNSNNEENSNQE